MTVNVFSSTTADGILAAILAPFFMSLGFFIWDVRWTKSGASAFALNMFKCNVASIGFIIMCFVRGFAISSSDYVNEDNDNNNYTTTESTNNVFTTTTVGFLILSSTLGIIIGDVLWLEALQLLGAKHVIVIDSLKPFMAALLGKLCLDEVLQGPAWGGMVLTVIGVGVVSWEEKRITLATIQKEDTNNIDANNNDNNEEGTTIIAQTESTARMIEFDNEEEEEEEENKANITTLGNTIIEDGNKNYINITKKETTSIVQTVTNNNTVELQRRCNITCSRERSVYRRGYICAIVNVLADSLGSLLTKIYGVRMTTWSINLIRFGFAGITLICISFGMRIHQHFLQSKNDATNNKDEDHDNNDATNNNTAVETPRPTWFELPTLSKIGWVQITTGVGLVTFLCPALSNFALFQIALGLAVSLGSITPLYALFLDWPFKGKRPTVRGCIGVMLAILGVVILCVWGT